MLYPVRQAVETVDYGDPLELFAVVSQVKAEQVLIEPGTTRTTIWRSIRFCPYAVTTKYDVKGKTMRCRL